MSHIPIEIRPVVTASERRAFARFPWRIHKADPKWVPPILADRVARLDPDRNPFFRHGEAEFFMAWQGREPVGTIASGIDHQVNENLGLQLAVFGFFDSVEDPAVGTGLLDWVVDWARERGMNLLRGPQSFSSSDEPGILIEGRETPPGLLMNWTPPYYRTAVEAYGFRKSSDSLAYRAYVADYVDQQGIAQIPRKVVRAADYVQRRFGDRYRIRPGNLDDWDRELETARSIYNRSLATLPAFSSMDQGQWRKQAKSLQPLLDPALVVFAEVDGEPVGFGLAVQDISTALRHCNGLRFPWDYLRLWWHSRRLPGVSFKILAMLPEYRGRGLDSLIFLQIARQVVQRGYQWIDLSLTGEDNPMTNKMALRLGARLDKRYRVYELDL